VQLFKRTIFWIEVVFTFLVLILGLLLTIKLLPGSANILESFVVIAEFSLHLLKIGIELVPQVPGIAVSALFWYSLYIGSLFYCSQTEKERKLLKLVVPISLVAVTFCSIGIFGAVFSSLASQGAGQ
jgi:uncharacterized membrane protein